MAHRPKIPEGATTLLFGVIALATAIDMAIRFNLWLPFGGLIVGALAVALIEAWRDQ